MHTSRFLHASEPPAAQPRIRLLELDVLRGIAALAVLACHYISHCQRLGHLDRDFRLGSFGAHLFFIISGFVIFLTLERCKHPADFVFSRVSRLYPVYWLGVAISASVIVLAPAAFESEPTTRQIFGNLTMLQTWMRIPDIEVAYWTLGVELKFYFLMFSLLLIRRLHWCEWFAAAWIVAIVTFRCLDGLVGLPHALATPLILDYGHLFAAGMMFHRLRTHGNTWLRHTIAFAAIPMQYWASGIEAAIVITSFVAIFYLFNAGGLTWIVNRPLTFLGGVSYPVYLVHGAMGTAIIHWLNGFNLPVVLLVSIPAGVSIVVAWLLTLLERPTLRWLRRRYRQWRRSDLSPGPAHAGSATQVSLRADRRRDSFSPI